MIVSEVEMDNNCAQQLFFKLFCICCLVPWKAYETAHLTIPEFHKYFKICIYKVFLT